MAKHIIAHELVKARKEIKKMRHDLRLVLFHELVQHGKNVLKKQGFFLVVNFHQQVLKPVQQIYPGFWQTVKCPMAYVLY